MSDQLGPKDAKLATVTSRSAGTLSFGRKVGILREIAIAYVPLLSLLRRNDLKAMVARARDVPPDHQLDAGDSLDAAIRIGWIVRRVITVLPTEKRCLIRSLVLVRLLERRGIENRLVLGVKGGTFAAHAWVEHGGVPVLPSFGYERLLEM